MDPNSTTGNITSNGGNPQSHQPPVPAIDLQIGRYYQNTQVDLIMVSADKAENCIDKFRNYLALKHDWLGAFGVALTAIATLAASTFNDKYLKPTTWIVLFSSFAILFSLIFIIKIIKYISYIHKTSTNWLITQLSGREAPLHPFKMAFNSIKSNLSFSKND